MHSLYPTVLRCASLITRTVVFLLPLTAALFLKSMTHEEWVLHELRYIAPEKYQSADSLRAAIKQNASQIKAIKENIPQSSSYYEGYLVLINELSQKWKNLDSKPFQLDDGYLTDNRTIRLSALLQVVPLWVMQAEELLSSVFLAWINDKTNTGLLRLREVMLESEELSDATQAAYTDIFSQYYTWRKEEQEDLCLKHLLGVADATQQLTGIDLARSWFAIVERADSYSFKYYQDEWRSSFLLHHALIRCCMALSMMPDWPADRTDQMRLLISLSGFFKKYDHNLALIKSVPSEHIEKLLSRAFNNAIESNGTIAQLIFGADYQCDSPIKIAEGIITTDDAQYTGFTDKKTPLVGALQAHWKAALWGANKIALKNLRYLAPLAANENFKSLWKADISSWVPFEDVAAGKNIHYSAVRNWCGYYRKPLAATTAALAVAGIVGYKLLSGSHISHHLPF